LQVISFIDDIALHRLEFESIPSKYDLDVDHLGIDIDFSELIGAESVVPEFVTINLEFLDRVRHIQGLSAAEVSVERARVIFRDLVGATAARHESLVTRHLVRLVAAVPCQILPERLAEHSSIVYA